MNATYSDNQWISTSTRLPQDGMSIDVWIEWLDTADGTPQGKRLTNCYVMGGRVRFDRQGGVINNYTYWMEAPAAPPFTILTRNGAPL